MVAFAKHYDAAGNMISMPQPGGPEKAEKGAGKGDITDIQGEQEHQRRK